jgi:hypothetical protein
MNSVVRRKLDMASRVREFTRAHVGSDPGYPPVLARLEELLPRAEEIAARQHQGRVAARGAQTRRMELRRQLQSQLMHYLVAVGSFASKDQAELSARFKLPDINATNQAFLTSVKALLVAAEGQRELLAKEGLVLASLDEVRQMVTDFEAASEVARTARRDHIGARADLEVTTTEMVEQVKVLDGVTRYRFGKDPEVMVEWKAARQVLGLPQNGATPPAAQSGDVKQAA